MFENSLVVFFFLHLHLYISKGLLKGNPERKRDEGTKDTRSWRGKRREGEGGITGREEAKIAVVSFSTKGFQNIFVDFYYPFGTENPGNRFGRNEKKIQY